MPKKENGGLEVEPPAEKATKCYWWLGRWAAEEKITKMTLAAWKLSNSERKNKKQTVVGGLEIERPRTQQHTKKQLLVAWTFMDKEQKQKKLLGGLEMEPPRENQQKRNCWPGN